MTTKRRLSVLLLCLGLATACAHGEQGKGATTHAQARERADERAEVAEQRSDPATPRDATDGERVEIPDSNRGRGRIATTGNVPSDDPKTTPAPNSAAAYGTEADNTRVNERDRSSAALTPLDQSGEKADVEITQRIRKAVMGEDALSFTAKNVKIITRDGHVTLRGSVKSQNERSTIEQLAKDAAGPGHVVNEIEVAD
jgi:hyperosmotically inducible protein